MDKIVFTLADVLYILGGLGAIALVIGGIVWAYKSIGLSNSKDIESLKKQVKMNFENQKEFNEEVKEKFKNCVSNKELDSHITNFETQLTNIKDIAQGTQDSIQTLMIQLLGKKIHQENNIQ